MNCINLSHPEFKRLQEETGFTSQMLAAKIGAWQNKNNSLEFPSSDYLLDKQDEIINKNQGDFTTDQNYLDRQEDIKTLFEENPELANTGTQQLYSQYFDTITNEVKDVLYHGGGLLIGDEFSSEYALRGEGAQAYGAGIYLTSSKKNAERYKKLAESKGKEGKVYPVVITSQNVIKYNDLLSKNIKDRIPKHILGHVSKDHINTYQDLYDLFVSYVTNQKGKSFRPKYEQEITNLFKEFIGNDAMAVNMKKSYEDSDYSYTHYIVNPEQIHRLGSKQDIEGFREFVNSKQKQKNEALINKIQEDFTTDFQLKVVDKLVNNVIDNRRTIRLNSKEKPYIETNLKKELLGLGVPSNQINFIFDYMRENDIQEISTGELALELASNYSYAVEINTAKVSSYDETDIDMFDPESRTENPKLENSQYYSNLTVQEYANNPDYEYREIELSTPLITPSIRGHAQFSTDKGIGWLRLYYNKKTGEVIILEVQSDLFQRGRNSKRLITVPEYNQLMEIKENYEDFGGFSVVDMKDGEVISVFNTREEAQKDLDRRSKLKPVPELTNKENTENQFLQLLNKDNNWVTFFIKSIIQDSAKKGYKKVLFPKGETAAKIEGHETIASELESLNRQINKEKDKLSNYNKIINEPLTEMEDLFGKPELHKAKRNKENAEIYIKQLEERKSELKSQGIEKLKPIEAFYENTLGNILNKQFGKNNIKIITDEYGNKWREITIDESRDLQPIALQKYDSDSTTKVSKKQNEALINKMRNEFKEVGIEVEVIENTSLEESANISKVGNKITITVNPNKIQGDSYHHEFGHLLVNMSNDPVFIKKGIELLRGTPLWNKIKETYPELSDEKLGFEVLTTAVGQRAKQIADNKEQDGRIKFWIRQLFRKIANLFNTEQRIIDKLANKLVSGNAISAINFDSYLNKEKQKLAEIDAYLDIISKHTTERFNSHNIKKDMYKNIVAATDKSMEVTDSISSSLTPAMLTNYRNATQIKSSLIKLIRADITEITSLLDKVQILKHKYLTKEMTFENTSKADIEILTQTLNNINDVISGYDMIEYIDEITDEEIDIIENPELKDSVQFIKDVYIKVIKEGGVINTGSGKIETEGILNTISKIKSAISSLNFAYRAYVIDQSTSPEMKVYEDAVKRALDPEKDESKLQQLFDPIQTSNVSFVANSIKMYNESMFQATLERDRKKRKFTKLLKEFHDAGFTVDDIVDKEQGRLVEQYNMSAFYEVFNKLSPVEKYKLVNNVFDLKPSVFIKERVEQERSRMKYAQFERWMAENVQIKKDGSYKAKLGGEFAKLNSKYENTYKNDKYTKVMANEKSAKLYNFLLNEVFQEYGDYVLSYQSKGFFPAIARSRKEYKKIKKERNKGKSKHVDVEKTNIQGETVYNIPFEFLGLLTTNEPIPIIDKLPGEEVESYEKRALKYIKDKGRGEYKSLEEVRDTNLSLHHASIKQHAASISYDLAKIIPMFIDSGTNFKYKKQIESQILANKQSIAEQEFVKLNGAKEKIKDFYRKRSDGTKEERTIKGKDSNVYKHYDDWIRMVFYEHFTDDTNYTEVAKKLKNYSSLIGMGFNFFAATKNISYGTYMMAAERVGKYHLSKLKKSYSYFTSGTTSYFRDAIRGGKMQDNRASSEQSAFIRYFEIIEKYDDLMEREKNSKINASYMKKLFNSVAYLGHEWGEFMMHNVTLFSMLHTNKIINGQIYSEGEYLEKISEDNKLDINFNDNGEGQRESDRQKLETYKDIIKQAKEEFNNAMPVKDAFEFIKDDGDFGYMNIKKVKDENGNEKPMLTERQISDFRQHIRSVNHVLHGVYDREHKGTVEKSPLMQLVLQYRHWARMGWNKRFGTRGGIFRNEPYWNEALKQYDVGDYKSFWKYMTRFFSTAAHITKEEMDSDSRGALEVFSAYTRNYLKTLAKWKLMYYDMTVAERAGLRRALMEQGIFISLMILGWAVASGWDDDDNKLRNFVLYQFDASRAELSTYLPYPGWLNEVSKTVGRPMATYSIAINATKLAREMIRYPFIADEDRVYKGGYNRGKSKILINATRITPGFNVAQRYFRLDQQTEAYRLFE